MEDRALSWISNVYLNMATFKNSVNISCQNSVLTNYVGFLSFALENFLKFCQNGFFEFKCRLSWNKQPILDLVRVSRESGILGLKNENPCFENFSEVPGSWFCLVGGEESQGF